VILIESWLIWRMEKYCMCTVDKSMEEHCTRAHWKFYWAF